MAARFIASRAGGLSYFSMCRTLRRILNPNGNLASNRASKVTIDDPSLKPHLTTLDFALSAVMDKTFHTRDFHLITFKKSGRDYSRPNLYGARFTSDRAAISVYIVTAVARCQTPQDHQHRPSVRRRAGRRAMPVRLRPLAGLARQRHGSNAGDSD